MTRRRVSTKSSCEPMMGYSQLDPREQNSGKYLSKFEHFHVNKMRLKMMAILARPQVLNQLSLNYFLRSHWQLCGIDSGSGLVPNGCQAIH